ncbi:MAG: sulfotransferase family protein [Actinomycetota bacterium]
MAAEKDTWLIDLVGAPASRVGPLVDQVMSWRDDTAPDAEVILLVDPEAEEEARRTGLSTIAADTPEEAAKATSTIGVTRTVALRDIAGIGTQAIQVEPTRVADARPRLGPPIFVGGTGRCGTWAVGRMIGRHTSITTVHTELRFHAVPRGFPAALAGSMTPDEFADSVMERWYEPPGGEGPKGLQLIVAREELAVALDQFRERAGDDLPRALQALMHDLVDPFALKRGANRWVETTPDNVASGGFLAKVFPGAKVIHMVRDGRDAAASVVNLGWGPSNIEDGLEWWARRMKAAQQGVAAMPANGVEVVRLEELVHFEREKTFQRLVDFLGIDSQPVAAYFETEMNGDAGHLGRWRSQVTAEERERINRRYREILAELEEVGTPCLPVDPERIDEVALSG